MKKQQYINSFLLIIVLITSVITVGCSDSSSGGTIETTNGFVANIDNTPANNAQVILVPNDFNAEISKISDLSMDTTDESGAYQLDIKSPGSYNIEIRSLENSTRALLTEAVSSEKTDAVPLIQLTHPGVFIINVPDSLSEEYVCYFSGTTYKWQISELDTTPEGALVFPDLPAAVLPSLSFDKQSLVEDIAIKSNDSTHYDLALTWRSFDTSNSSIPSDKITSIFTDKNGWHWIGTYGGGVGVHADTMKSFLTGVSNLPSNNVNDLSIDKYDWTYIATANGAFCKNQTTIEQELLKADSSIVSLSSNIVICVAIDSSNGAWFGTSKGLDHYTRAPLVVKNYLSGINIADVTVSQNGNVWVATALNGIHVFDGSQWNSFDSSTSNLSSNRTNSIIELNTGDIVVGHWNGKLSTYNGSSWSQINNEQSSADDQPILCFYETDNNTLYAGTGLGLIKRENGFWKRTLGTAYDELEQFSIRSISSDQNGNIWVGTGANGVYVFGENAQDIIFKRILHFRSN